MTIDQFIKELSDSDEYIHHIYTKGGCYKFHVLLSKLYNGSIPYINKQKNHIITKYRNKFYDINGEVIDISNYQPLRYKDLEMVKKWSFRKHNLIKLNECPNCEEPLTFR